MGSPEAEDRDPGTAVRDAASVVLVKRSPAGPAVLMGRRGAGAAFMPSKFVFPGGAVDPQDAHVPFAEPLPATCRARLAAEGTAATPEALAAAAIRELWEEAGLILGVPGGWPGGIPRDWVSFAQTGNLPTASGLRFVFRAVTPPGNTRRFDARFFLADAALVSGDPEDFSRASDELSDLTWVPLAEARRYDLPLITQVVLAEVSAHLRGVATPGVPFFRQGVTGPQSLRL